MCAISASLRLKDSPNTLESVHCCVTVGVQVNLLLSFNAQVASSCSAQAEYEGGHAVSEMYLGSLAKETSSLTFGPALSLSLCDWLCASSIGCAGGFTTEATAPLLLLLEIALPT